MKVDVDAVRRLQKVKEKDWKRMKKALVSIASLLEDILVCGRARLGEVEDPAERVKVAENFDAIEGRCQTLIEIYALMMDLEGRKDGAERGA